MSQSPSIIPGSTVNERFSLTRPLGKGSMGTVWLARHLALDIDVALKFIDSSLTKQLNYVERFRREARAAAQIKSPHVVGVLDYGTDQKGRPFMAMEYLEGDTLGAFMDRNPRLGPNIVARIVSHAARGLSKAHALGVVHRDIKPENLFMCGDHDEDSFVLKILDFGVAKAGFTTNGHGTLAGQLIGSPAYMSPEQARSYKSIDHRTDLFSLAVVAYQCLTGVHPFHGNGLGELLLSICTNEPTPPSKLALDLPAEIDEFFVKALAKKPHERFQNAREMGVAFCDALGLNVASGIDIRSSYSPLSLANSRDMPPPEVAPEAEVSDIQATRVIVPGQAPRPESSSRIQPMSIADALTPLTSVPHALGVALLDHNGECLLMRGKELNRDTFTLIANHARTVAETVESIEQTTQPTHLSVRFSGAAVYLRWIGPFTLVVHGGAQLRALLLTVGSNKLASRLESFMQQLGGVEPASNLLRESGVGLPPQALTSSVSTPQINDSEGEGEGERSTLPSRGVTLPAPADAAGKSAGQTAYQPVPSPKVSAEETSSGTALRSFFGLGSRASKAAAPTAQASSVSPTPAHPTPAPPPAAEPPDRPSLEQPGQATTATRRPRVLVHRGKAIGGTSPKPEEKPQKRKILYRGKVIDEK